MTGSRRITVGLGVAAVALAAAAAYGFGGGEPDAAPREPPMKTAEVVRMTLVDYEDAPGEIDFGDITPLRYIAPPPDPPATPPTETPPTATPPADDGLGLVTWLPAVGSIVERGKPALRVDDRPVVLLFGALPLYRTLASGVVGADVKQLERNLRELGFTGFTVDDRFSAATATAARQWQKALGLAQTGAVAPGQVLYAAGPIRVAEHRLSVGDVAGGDILGYTASVRIVTARLSEPRRDVTPGTRVTVIMAGGAELAATVRRVSVKPAEPGGPGDSTINVEVVVADQGSLDGRQGAVRVRFVTDERRDVLAVPVLALVALAEGGYGVQVVNGSSVRYVAVRTGMFARGFVEITSGDLNVGTRVVVPA